MPPSNPGRFRLPTQSDEDPEGWARTPTGELFYRAKYRGSRAAATALGNALEAHVLSNPIMRAATTVLAIPSSGTRVGGPDLPSGWAKQIARALNVRIGTIRRLSAAPAQKTVAVAERQLNQANSMVVDCALADEAVLLIDDIYTTGETMAEGYRAIRATSATSVLGLNAVKTVQGTRGYQFV